MPDITLCSNFTCPMRYKCTRGNSEPDEYAQSYSEFEPNMNGECDYFLEDETDDFAP